jgi:hypothetical protein
MTNWGIKIRTSKPCAKGKGRADKPRMIDIHSKAGCREADVQYACTSYEVVLGEASMCMYMYAMYLYAIRKVACSAGRMRRRWRFRRTAPTY